MTLSALLNDECYESSLIEDLVYLDIDDGSLQDELEHSPNSGSQVRSLGVYPSQSMK